MKFNEILPHWEIVNENFIPSHSILQFLAFAFALFEILQLNLDSFKFQKFMSHNAKAMTKDKKVNITVTYFNI